MGYMYFLKKRNQKKKKNLKISIRHFVPPSSLQQGLQIWPQLQSTCFRTLKTAANHTCILSTFQKYGRHGNATRATITHSGHFHFLKSCLKNNSTQNSLFVFCSPVFSLFILVILPPIDLLGAWPGLLMCCRAELVWGVALKRSSVLHLQITLHNHFLLPTHSSQAAPVCQGRKKPKQRGSVQPGAEHRTLFILSSPQTLLSQSPTPASGWLYLKNSKIFPPVSAVLRAAGCSPPSPTPSPLLHYHLHHHPLALGRQAASTLPQEFKR